MCAMSNIVPRVVFPETTFTGKTLVAHVVLALRLQTTLHKKKSRSMLP